MNCSASWPQTSDPSQQHLTLSTERQIGKCMRISTPEFGHSAIFPVAHIPYHDPIAGWFAQWSHFPTPFLQTPSKLTPSWIVQNVHSCFLWSLVSSLLSNLPLRFNVALAVHQLNRFNSPIILSFLVINLLITWIYLSSTSLEIVPAIIHLN